MGKSLKSGKTNNKHFLRQIYEALNPKLGDQEKCPHTTKLGCRYDEQKHPFVSSDVKKQILVNQTPFTSVDCKLVLKNGFGS